jgi:acetolactate synthase-1/2/3 large subunit
MVKDVEDLPYMINKAFTIAASGRPGPVLIDLPVDVTSAIMARSVSPSYLVPGYSDKMLTHEDLIDTQNNHLNIAKAASLINNSKRPVIYAGQGIVYHPEGPSVLALLAHKANIPVTTTFNALGSFDEEDPKSLHMLGVHGTGYANLAIQNADLIIALGARFDERAIISIQKFAPNTRKASKENRGGIIQFEKLAKNKNRVNADIVVGGDVTENLKQLVPLVKSSERTEWFEMIQQWRLKYPFYYEKTIDDSQPLKPQQVIEAFETQIKDKKDKVIVTTGVGNHQLWATNIIRWRTPRSFISSGGFGTMGYGLGSAIGCKIGKPNHIVVDIDGDSSFSMMAMELATAAALNICIKVIIINNSSQSMIQQYLDVYCEKRAAGTQTKNPDFVKLAEAMDVRVIRVSKVSELDEKMEEFLAYNEGPIVMDVMTCKDEHLYPIVPRGHALDQFFPHLTIAERNSME